MKEEIDTCREELKRLENNVKDLKKKVAAGSDPEVIANLTLSIRHIEDARMRLGKALQYLGDGVSCYDNMRLFFINNILRSIFMRAKFRVDEKTETTNGFGIKMNAVHSGSEENKEFFKWTPNGQLTMGVVKKEIADQFEIGAEYYLDFTKA